MSLSFLSIFSFLDPPAARRDTKADKSKSLCLLPQTGSRYVCMVIWVGGYTIIQFIHLLTALLLIIPIGWRISSICCNL